MIPRTVKPLLIALAACLLVFAFTAQFSDLVSIWEGSAYDARLRLRGPATAHPAIVLIGRDEDSEARFGKGIWNRAVFADLIAGLHAAGAKVIALDFHFGGASPPERGGQASDTLLVDAVRRSGNVVLALPASLKPSADGRDLMTVTAVGRSLPDLLESAAATGHIAAVSDVDEVYRSVPAFVNHAGTVVPALSVAAAARFLDALVSDLQLPTDASGRVLVDYAGAWPDGRFPYLSLVDVLDAIHEARWDELRQVVSGKLVVVVHAASEGDKRRTPFEAKAPGGFIHTNAINTVLQGGPLRAAPRRTVLIVMIAGALLGAAGGVRLRSWGGLAAGACVAIGYAAGTLLALARGVVVPIVPPLMTLGVAMALGLAVRQAMEDRNRRWVQHALRRYLGRTVGDQIAANPEALKLGGVPQDITVMFADLSGFTTLSGRVPPEQLSALTNQYLSLLLQEIETANGYVVQFLGDCVMAIWGAPNPDSEHAQHAAQAALAVARRIEQHNAQAMAKKEWWFGVKVGLNTGPAMVGNIGDETRYNFTAVGETVNVASRIEGVASAYACHIAVGEETARRLGGHFLLRELDTVIVKGREQPLTVFELLATHATATNEQRERAGRYAEALELYRAGKFSEAAKLWEALAADEPALQRHADSPERNNPCRCMASRARRLAAEPSTAPWTGVWTMTSK